MTTYLVENVIWLTGSILMIIGSPVTTIVSQSILTRLFLYFSCRFVLGFQSVVPLVQSDAGLRRRLRFGAGHHFRAGSANATGPAVDLSVFFCCVLFYRCSAESLIDNAGLLRQQTNPTYQNSEISDRVVVRRPLVWVTARTEQRAHVVTTPLFIRLPPGGDRRRVVTVARNIRY